MSPHRQDENKPPRDGRKADRASIASRDQPLFQSRRQYRGPNAVPEFFTDSLNTSFASHIPSPSPGRPSYGGRSRTRQERGGGNGNNDRGLAAAFNSLDSGAHDTASNTSSPTKSAGRRSAQRARHSHIPSPQRSPTRNTPSPRKGRAHHSQEFISDTKTPSPTRGRQRDFLVSPATSDISHFSSPPVGLADVYQRIQDEETLASQEEDDEDTEGEEWPEDQVLQEVPNGQQRRSWHSRSPETRRRISPRPLHYPDEAPGGQQELGRLSLFSELDRASRESSPFDEEPVPEADDDMASQHERDEQRVRSALSNHARPFSKARRGRKIGLTTDNLRKADGSQSGSNSTGSRSIDSRASELSLNVPNGWGRKGRTNKSWLNRIAEDGSSITKPGHTEAHPSGGSAKSDSIVDWMESASAIPIPSANNEALPPSNSQPNLVRFGAHSSISPPEQSKERRAQSTTPTNTPPRRARNTALDLIRLREIQNASEESAPSDTAAVSTEATSTEHHQNGPREIEHSLEAPDTNERVTQASEDLSWPAAKPVTDEDNSELLDLENLPQPPQSKLVIDPNRKPLFEPTTSKAGQKRRDIEPTKTQAGSSRVERPQHSRGDSRDILRTLARVESNSPSPHRTEMTNTSARRHDNVASPTQEAPRPLSDSAVLPPASTEQPSIEDEQAKNDVETTRPVDTDTSSKAKSSEPQTNDTNSKATASHPKIPVPVRIPAARPSQPNENEDVPTETPAVRVPKQKVYLKTPTVTGAWIETPLPTVKRDISKDAAQQAAEQKALLHRAFVQAGVADIVRDAIIVQGDKEVPLRLEDTAPKLPGSALADIIQQAKAKRSGMAAEENDDTLLLDDSTIDSLEDLLEMSSDGEGETSKAAAPSRPHGKEPTGKKPSDDPSAAGGSNARVPRKATEVYDNMVQRLSFLHSSIQDASKDLGSLGRTVSASPRRRKQQARTKSTTDNDDDTDEELECDEGGEVHDWLTRCEKCARREAAAAAGAGYQTGPIEWQPMMVPVLRLWAWPRIGWPRLTKRGWWALCIVALVALELIVADAYTPPFYASSMVGYGVDYNMPRPPFILAKLAWRNGLSTLFGPFVDFIVAIAQLLAPILGLEGEDLSNDDEYEWRYHRVMYDGPFSREDVLNGRIMQSVPYRRDEMSVGHDQHV